MTVDDLITIAEAKEASKAAHRKPDKTAAQLETEARVTARGTATGKAEVPRVLDTAEKSQLQSLVLRNLAQARPDYAPLLNIEEDPATGVTTYSPKRSDEIDPQQRDLYNELISKLRDAIGPRDVTVEEIQ